MREFISILNERAVVNARHVTYVHSQPNYYKSVSLSAILSSLANAVRKMPTHSVYRMTAEPTTSGPSPTSSGAVANTTKPTPDNLYCEIGYRISDEIYSITRGDLDIAVYGATKKGYDFHVFIAIKVKPKSWKTEKTVLNVAKHAEIVNIVQFPASKNIDLDNLRRQARLYVGLIEHLCIRGH